MSIKLLKQLALASILALASLSSAQAAYHYENTTNLSGKWMDSYSTTWHEASETLSINSTWTTPTSGALTKISFLLSDGGSPWVTGNHSGGEQFLWYDVDLATSIVTVTNYFAWDGNSAKSVVLDTFNASSGVNVTSNSLSLTLDHAVLNALSFTGRSYIGAGFTNDIGIWYYMSGPGTYETYDVHHGGTTVVPVPAALFLFAPALLGFLGFRRKMTA